MPRAKKTNDKNTGKTGEICLGVLPNLIGYQVRLAQIAIFRDFSCALGDLDITPGLFGVLVIVEANPGLKQAELARATHLDRSTVVSVVDKLEKRGLVKRHHDTADRRSNSLQLTEQGATLLAHLKPQVTDHEQRLISNLTPTEQIELTRLLGNILPDMR